MSNRQSKKLEKKTKRCQMIIEKEAGVQFTGTAEMNLAICNAGLSTGLQPESILSEIENTAGISSILMLPGKSYCFLTCSTVEDSQKIFKEFHGKAKLGQNNGIVYLSFCKNIPILENPWNVAMSPEGLIIIEEFITHEEEEKLIKWIPWEDENISSVKHRQVKHFGYDFIYGSNNVDKRHPLERGIPTEFSYLWQRFRAQNSNVEWPTPDQLTVNKYEPGQGIPAHCDTHSAFTGPIVSLSLGSDAIMEFKKSTGENYSILLPARSLLLMTGECRYDWTHAITPRFMDIIPSDSKHASLTVRKRSTRLSYTFRKLRNGPCDCQYPFFCDSKKEESDSNDKCIKLSAVAAKVEEENVHKIYNEIAQHFSETRHTPWRRVSEFIENFPSGSLVVDIGCGNGKYMLARNDIMKIGCDRSDLLLQVCHQRQLNVVQCDCLALPFRDESANACLSIAVIHHLASKERRIQAVKEMARILQMTGLGLIYVWAKNQEANNKKSSYLRQNKNLMENRAINEGDSSTTSEGIALPIHTNRTQFRHRDILVPWKLKEATNNHKTFLRYYHVFEEGELEDLCAKVKSIKIVNSYYDQGNWCIVFEKL
ncbi:Alkylated DNA repair protein alkB homolog 8 [Sergentomyia squamirostris]